MNSLYPPGTPQNTPAPSGAVDSTSNQTMKMTSTWNNQSGGAPTATFEAGVVSLIK